MRVTHDRGVYTERRRGRMVVEVVGRADLALGVENRVRGGGRGGGVTSARDVWK